MQEAEQRQEELEGEIHQITREWEEKLLEVREESERTLNANELKEFQTRIAQLSQELSDKQREIDQISNEKKRIENTMD